MNARGSSIYQAASWVVRHHIHHFLVLPFIISRQ